MHSLAQLFPTSLKAVSNLIEEGAFVTGTQRFRQALAESDLHRRRPEARRRH
jgi:hypothetical protein